MSVKKLSLRKIKNMRGGLVANCTHTDATVPGPHGTRICVGGRN